MSDDDWNLALPPFKPGDALVQLKRSLRDLKLAERGESFEYKARRVIELRAEPDHVAVRLARRPALAPDWESRALKSGADVRKFVDEVRRRLPRWDQDD
jgi:hypothetical protein